MEPHTGLDTDWLITLLKQSFHDIKPTRIVKVDVESAVPKGENYTSTIKRVKMKVITASGARKTVSMIVKLAKSSDETNGVLEGYSIFQIETKMFTTILKHMEALMDEFGDKREPLWAKLYGYEPYTSMVLQDLKDQNFILADRRAWLGLDHGLLVLRSLGRFHAMSKILIGRGLITDDDKGVCFLADSSLLSRALINGPIHMLSQAMRKRAGHWPSGWENTADRIAKQKEVLCDKLEALYKYENKKFEVLNHGDLWSSNMMFKEMEYTGIPTEVRFVDFQAPHLSSFMWDVNNFIYTSVKPSVRRVHLVQLLTAYHTSLSDNMKFFKWNGYIPTLNDVMKEAERFLPVAFAFLVAFMPLGTATSQNSFKMEKLLDSPPEEVFDDEIYCEEKFVKEVADDIKYFADLGII